MVEKKDDKTLLVVLGAAAIGAAAWYFFLRRKITLAVSNVSPKVGDIIIFSGKIDPAKLGESVDLQFTDAAGKFVTFASLTTDVSGIFTRTLTITTAGSFQAQAVHGSDTSTAVTVTAINSAGNQTCAQLGGICESSGYCTGGRQKIVSQDCSSCCVLPTTGPCSKVKTFTFNVGGTDRVHWDLGDILDVCELELTWKNGDPTPVNASTLVVGINGSAQLPGDTGCSVGGQTSSGRWVINKPVAFLDFAAATGGCFHVGVTHVIAELTAKIHYTEPPPPPTNTCAAQGGQCTSADICNIKGGHAVSSTDCTRVCCAPGSPAPLSPGSPPPNQPASSGVRTWWY